MKIIDGFMFYNELDILETRLHEVYDVVDHIILVEATKTHTGNDKPLYYNENKARFEKYNDKIVHIVTNFEEHYDFESAIHQPTIDWFRENYQREVINTGLKQLNLQPNDIIHVSDTDEIPAKRILKSIRSGDIIISPSTLYSLELTLYYYNIELTTPRLWYQSNICTYSTTINQLLSRMRLVPNRNIIRSAGWHLSYFGDENFIKNKVESFAESREYLTKNKRIEHLKDCLDKSILHFNKEKLIHVPLLHNENVPSFYKKRTSD